MIILILLILLWVIIGGVTYWYMETRYQRNDIPLSEIFYFALACIAGMLTLIIAITHIWRMSDKIIFKAKK